MRARRGEDQLGEVVTRSRATAWAPAAVLVSAAVLIPRTVDNWGGFASWMAVGCVLSAAALTASLAGVMRIALLRPKVTVGLLVLQLLFWGVAATYGTR